MRICVVAVGKPGLLAAPVREYERRAARYWRFEAVEARQGRGRSAREVLAIEEDGIRAKLRARYMRVAVSREGASFSSTELARWLERVATGPERGVHFVIGGAFGLSERLRRECERTLSLSSFTLPHDLARLVLAEQLYRAGAILGNEPYHKGPR